MNRPDLAAILYEWFRSRQADSGCRWPYHPRSNDIADVVRRAFARDLIEESPEVYSDARSGALACDVNLRMRGDGRTKALDLALGRPKQRLTPIDRHTSEVLRKAELSEPLIVLETKTCMTRHSHAITRLCDELVASVRVARGAAQAATCVGVVIINVSERFTSPLHLPGPNIHRQPQAALSVVRAVLDRVPHGVRSGGYDALAMVAISTDNERVSELPQQSDYIPEAHRYPEAIACVSALYRSLVRKR
jgi:hypothetical protein